MLINKEKMPYILFALAFLVAFLMLIFYLNISLTKFKDGQRVDIKIGKITINAEVSASPIKQEKGLSGRESLKDGEGMVFIFPDERNLNFWMKDMKFDLDFIWVNKDRIVDISENVPVPGPDKKINAVKPKEPANIVIEVSAGFVARNGVKIGDEVIIEKTD